jgi:hypothetical protein
MIGQFHTQQIVNGRQNGRDAPISTPAYTPVIRAR